MGNVPDNVYAHRPSNISAMRDPSIGGNKIHQAAERGKQLAWWYSVSEGVKNSFDGFRRPSAA